jgi:predicted transcriptional regulator
MAKLHARFGYPSEYKRKKWEILFAILEIGGISHVEIGAKK